MEKRPKTRPALPSNMEEWTKHQVYQWLTCDLKVNKVYADKILEEDVSGSDLLCFQKKDLIEIGLKHGPAVKICHHIEIFKKSEVPSFMSKETEATHSKLTTGHEKNESSDDKSTSETSSLSTGHKDTSTPNDSTPEMPKIMETNSKDCSVFKLPSTDQTEKGGLESVFKISKPLITEECTESIDKHTTEEPPKHSDKHLEINQDDLSCTNSRNSDSDMVIHSSEESQATSTGTIRKDPSQYDDKPVSQRDENTIDNKTESNKTEISNKRKQSMQDKKKDSSLEKCEHPETHITTEGNINHKSKSDKKPLQIKSKLDNALPFPFDQPSAAHRYVKNQILPPETGPGNLIDPVHEYKLLCNTENANEGDVLKKFSNEVFRFSSACMNSRTNGTIHFGVGDKPVFKHGQIVGIEVPSPDLFIDHFNKSLKEYFKDHSDQAEYCIRQPRFVPVLDPTNTLTGLFVIEVDVVPNFEVCQENTYEIYMMVNEKNQWKKTKEPFLFIRDGTSSKNILGIKNPKDLQKELASFIKKVKKLATMRKSKEQMTTTQSIQYSHGEKLKRLFTCEKGMSDCSLYDTYLIVANKCHPNHLEHLQFLTEINLFAVLEFDPESEINGVCAHYRKNRIANLHYPRDFNSTDSESALIAKLNLYKQTSWIFCNGRADLESESDGAMNTSNWLTKRAADVKDLISFFCKPQVLQSGRYLVVFLLLSPIEAVNDPVLEIFCTFYQNLEGAQNILCICDGDTIFSKWKELIKVRCDTDITNRSIYQLNFTEINGTLMKLKPQTQTSIKFLPSSGSSSVVLEKRDEDLMTSLDVLCENECENTGVEKGDEFEEFKNSVEETFYRGGKVTWWNFYLSERPRSIPFIKRDKYESLFNMINSQSKFPTSQCVILNLFHHPGCGGTTLAMHVLWNLRKQFRCAVLKNTTVNTSEIAVQIIHLLTCGKQEQSSFTPVLLLVDDLEEWGNLQDLQRCILNTGASKQIKKDKLLVIILSCVRSQDPGHSSKNCLNESIYIANKLSVKEQKLFEAKLMEIQANYSQFETFYGFMIMKNNFSSEYTENLVHNILKHLDISTKEAQLISFFALLNSYVDGSSISVSICEDFLGIKNAFWGRENVEDKMGPYSTLLIRFKVEEYGTYWSMRMLHQMIATECLRELIKTYSLKLSDITINLLHCDLLYKTAMGKDELIDYIQSMLIKRQKIDHGDERDTLFSPLIEKMQEEGQSQIKQILFEAEKRFEKNPFIPQVLARHFYLKEKNFESAAKWAQVAKQKKCNSYLADTLGQVYKSHLKYEFEKSENAKKELTVDDLTKYLYLASKANKAFQESQNLAKRDDAGDSQEQLTKRKNNNYNTSGYLGEMEVAMVVFDILGKIPCFLKKDKLKQLKLVQFLKKARHLSEFHENETDSKFIGVLKEHEEFLTNLKPSVKQVFEFFENCFTYLKPRSAEKETADLRNRRKVSEYFTKYIKLFCASEQDLAAEKMSKPNISLQQNIEERRMFLERKRADHFSGLLQCLHGNDINSDQMEKITDSYLYIWENSSSRDVKDTANFILANIVLNCIKPKSKKIKRYAELTLILNNLLQDIGTHYPYTEPYYLAQLLLWPEHGCKLDNGAKNISTYVTSIKNSFKKQYNYLIRSKHTIAHFYLGKSSGLKRLIPKAKLDLCLGEEKTNSQWISGEVWREEAVKNLLFRVHGTTEYGEVYVSYDDVKIPVRPVYLGGLRSGYSIEKVSFYLGFSIDGPVAYDIQYKKNA
ncbi:sterile alpha motif domain-containing protein 9 isoform X2 [Erpetoichthys calabaricus]|uniref:Sterile alpha motif domain containing 9 n=1 Tax=Erpetoichthys calabaricus TaxID=27687 RepID=A0A8C4S1A9_ERPCA|nr:sterile alpha motif domain-containing protein 9 isoform X2 [Erpetoichthys calabaricus]